MKIELLHAIPHAEELRDVWNELVHQMEQPEVCYTYEWACAVQCAYRESLPPLLVVGYQNDDLAGVAALTLSRDGKTASFLTRTTADYCDFVSRPELRSEFVTATLRALRKAGISNLVFANLPADSATTRCLPGAMRAAGLYSFSRQAYLCAQIEINRTDDSVQAARLQHRNQNIRRKLKKLEPIEVKHLKSAESVQAVLPQFTRQHVARFLSHGQLSNLVQPERRRFLQELSVALSRAGWMKFTQLESAGVPVASNYGFEFEGNWFWYQPTFDIEYAKHLPGLCLLSKIVEEASLDDRVVRVDMGLGEEEYKARMATCYRQTLQVLASRSAIRCALEAGRYAAARTIKRRPGLERLARNAFAGVSKVRTRVRSEGFAGLRTLTAELSRRFIASDTEVLFFEWPGGAGPEAGEFCLKPLDLEILAESAMRLAKEDESLNYLRRAAQRLDSGSHRGFALTSERRRVQHFLWLTQFDDFVLSEIRHCLKAPRPGSVLIYDCWTPIVDRAHGYYSKAIAMLASQLQRDAVPVWIFSASSNIASIRGIEKAGFLPRFSLRQRRLFGQALRVNVQPVEAAQVGLLPPLVKVEST